MLATENPANDMRKYQIPREEYLHYLAKNVFFIAPPGRVMPHEQCTVETLLQKSGDGHHQ